MLHPLTPSLPTPANLIKAGEIENKPTGEQGMVHFHDRLPSPYSYSFSRCRSDFRSGVELNKVFDSIIQNALSLPSTSKTKALEVCKAIKDDIQNLIAYTNESSELLGSKIDNTRKMLLRSTDEYTITSRQLQRQEAEYEKLGTQLSDLNEKEDALSSHITQITAEISVINKKIISQNHGIEVLHVLNLFGKVFGPEDSTKYLENAIENFQAEINRLDEVFVIKNNEARYLSQEKEVLLQKQTIQKELIDRTRLDIERGNLQICSIDKKLKLLGKNHTDLLKIKTFLESTLSDYAFLKLDLDSIDIFIKEGLTADAQEMISEFTKAIETIRSSFPLPMALRDF